MFISCQNVQQTMQRRTQKTDVIVSSLLLLRAVQQTSHAYPAVDIDGDW